MFHPRHSSVAPALAALGLALTAIGCGGKAVVDPEPGTGGAGGHGGMGATDVASVASSSSGSSALCPVALVEPIEMFPGFQGDHYFVESIELFDAPPGSYSFYQRFDEFPGPDVTVCRDGFVVERLEYAWQDTVGMLNNADPGAYTFRFDSLSLSLRCSSEGTGTKNFFDLPGDLFDGQHVIIQP